MIESETITGTTYYTTEHRKVKYCARWVDYLGKWEVHSQRMALGHFNPGTVRHFDTAAELAASVTAFRGFDQLTDEGR